MKNNFDVFLTVDDSRWTAAIPEIAAVIENVKDVVLQEVSSTVEYLQVNKNFVANLCLSDDTTVHKLNLEFRGMDKPTNVLSFANIDSDDFDDMLEFDDEVEMGDIIIAYETMEREAKEQEVSFEHHFCHLWVHGLLHIIGYDHIEEDERSNMERLETAILAKLNIEDPYKE